MADDGRLILTSDCAQHDAGFHVFSDNAWAVDIAKANIATADPFEDLLLEAILSMARLFDNTTICYGMMMLSTLTRVGDIRAIDSNNGDVE